MSVSGQEKVEINLAVDLYIEGMRTGDAAKLREAFHPQAWMFGSMAGTRYDEPIGELIALVDGQPVDVEGSYKARVTSIEHVGDAAFAIQTRSRADELQARLFRLRRQTERPPETRAQRRFNRRRRLPRPSSASRRNPRPERRTSRRERWR